MNHRLLHRAIALSLGALLAFAGTVAADSAPADGETAVGIQKVANLGQVAPGAVRSVDIRFVLTCVGTTHLDPGQTVTFGVDSAVAPEGGAILSVTDGTVGPLSPTWPADGTACPVAGQTFAAGTPSVVTVRAPMAPGPYTYSLRYHRSVEPFGVNDPTAINGSSAIEIVLVVNTPPSLTLPIAAMAGTIEANTAGGWTADWAGLGATDAEDVPDPAATCAPADGTVLSLGTTSVTCGVTDGGGLSESASFDVTVADTAVPTLGAVPGDQSLTTGDPTGTTLTYTPPTATDVADADPVVDCLPASGSHVSVGTTTVTCTATDDSGNAAQATFAANVTYVQPHVATARWGEPIAGFESAFSANRGRTIPVKVELFWDGAPRASGLALLTLSPCGGGASTTSTLTYSGGRWHFALETGLLAGSCHVVVASIDGLEAGAFRLELRGAEPAKASNVAPDTTSSGTPAKTKDAKPVKGGETKPVKAGNSKP